MEKRIIGNLTLLVFKDKRELAKVASQQLLKLAKQTRGNFNLALAGGKTPEILYREMARPSFARRFPWKKTHFFWTDERWVPRDHPRSNFYMAEKSLLRKVDVPESNIHRIRTEFEFPAAAGNVYEKEILSTVPRKNRFPVFDLILLGLGEDGHVASLFPGGALLKEKKRSVGVSRIKNETRVSLTLPVLRQAKNLFFLVTGPEKTGILRRLLNQDPLPSTLAVQGRKNTVIYCDKACAGSLIL